MTNGKAVGKGRRKLTKCWWDKRRKRSAEEPLTKGLYNT